MSNNNRRTKGRFHLIGLAAALAVLALVFAVLFFLNPDSAQVFAPAGDGTGDLAVSLPTAEPTAAPTAEPATTAAAAPAVPTAVPTASATQDPDAPFAYLPVVTRGDNLDKVIAITIDDCNEVENLKKICGMANHFGGDLTLFPIGENVENPELAEVLRGCVFQLGFQVENHTYSHARIFRLPEEEMAAEIWKQRDAVNRALGVNYQQSFLRMMGGDGAIDQRTHNYLKQLGYKGVAGWTISGSDATAQMLNHYLRPGAIFLFHATNGDTDMLEAFIPYAVNQGYRLVTLNELLGLPANTWTDLSTAETAAPAPAPYRTEYIEQKTGDYSWAVVRIQQKLAELGYLGEEYQSALADSAADGVYGAGTAEAVARFQTDRGLPATGIADVATQQALLGEE